MIVVFKMHFYMNLKFKEMRMALRKSIDNGRMGISILKEVFTIVVVEGSGNVFPFFLAWGGYAIGYKPGLR